jgi:hypothetical protein
MAAERDSGFAEVNDARLYYAIVGDGELLAPVYTRIAYSRMCNG